jgi:hypothetical protein
MNKRSAEIKRRQAVDTKRYKSATKTYKSKPARHNQHTWSRHPLLTSTNDPLLSLAQRSHRNEDETMTKTLTAGLLAGTFALLSVGQANAWTRDGSISGPRGTASVHANGGCTGGSCSRSINRTGPDGYSMSRSGSVSCDGGYCNGSRTTTGPRGNTVTRSGSFHRY